MTFNTECKQHSLWSYIWFYKQEPLFSLRGREMINGEAKKINKSILINHFSRLIGLADLLAPIGRFTNSGYL